MFFTMTLPDTAKMYTAWDWDFMEFVTEPAGSVFDYLDTVSFTVRGHTLVHEISTPETYSFLWYMVGLSFLLSVCHDPHCVRILSLLCYNI
jgi:hypothetical protein